MGQWVTINSNDGDFDAYVARPASGRTKAGVVVIQEIFGVNAVMQAKVEWLAREGLTAICPDLFWRQERNVNITDQSEAEWAKAMSLMQGFDQAKGVGDIQSTINFLRGAGARIGTMGYCLGGLMAYLSACRTNADAAVGYYGVSIDQKLNEAVGSTTPLMLHIAGKDQFVKPDAQKAIIDALGKRPNVQIHVYPEQDHAFTREGGAHYDAAAAKLADERTVAFLKEKLA
ncbi:MAG: dienelactone hydrolase family protein [Hyphomonadaceae bacterium]